MHKCVIMCSDSPFCLDVNVKGVFRHFLYQKLFYFLAKINIKTGIKDPKMDWHHKKKTNVKLSNCGSPVPMCFN